MTDSRRPITPPTDDAIRVMLELRASRVHAGSIDLATIVAAAGPRASLRLRGALGLAPRLSLVASTLAAVLVASALIAIPLLNRPTGSGTPSGLAEASGATASPSDVGPSSAPTSSVRLLTPAEVGELARTQSAELSTKIAAVRGLIELDVSSKCSNGPTPCANATLADGGPGVRVRLIGSLRTELGSARSRTAAWVIRFTTDTEKGLPVIDLVGDLAVATDGRLAWTVAEILGGAGRKSGGYAAVQGWLVRTPLDPCPSRPPLPPGVITGGPVLPCMDRDYLTPMAWQPLQADGSSLERTDAIEFAHGTYDRWAPDPAPYGPDGVGAEPRQATFLMQLSMDSRTPDGADWVDGPHPTWHLVDRFDPIPDIPPTASTDPGPNSAPTSSIRLLTPAEVGELARTRSRELSTMIVATSGRLERDPSMPCAKGAICADTLLADSGGGFHIKPVGDIGPGPWDGSGPKQGTFVLRITPNLEGGRPVFEYLGDLQLPSDGVLAWSVSGILSGTASKQGVYAAVDGWLVRDSLHPCASTSRPSDISYGCPTDDWLTPSAYQPTQPDGSMLGPREAIYLASGSYDHWAPDPAQFGIGGVEPRRATYLMWLVMDGCGPNADCAQGPDNLHWRIVGRFDPIPNLEAALTTAPSLVPVPLVARWRVADLAALPSSAAPIDYQVQAYLVRTPPLKCLAVSAGLPNYSCDEVDWLTDAPFQPWVSDGNSGATREPSVGLRVQNGAYDAFATDPARGPLGAWEPRLGDYLVRRSTAPACAGGAQSSGAPCYGGTAIPWEITARLP